MGTRDLWADWLLARRFPDEDRRPVLAYLGRIRDKVLDNAGLLGGETLLDVGCGDGLIGFGAMDRGAGKVVFSDVSQDLLDTCESAASELGLADRCRFALASADDLAVIESRSVDVVTTRSVLIYVKDKEQAFAEFYRVLRPGGRVSLFEPINSFSRPVSPGWLWAYELPGLEPLVERVGSVFERNQPPDSDPMLDFDERDLVRLAEQAGFGEIQLQLTIEVKSPGPRSWESFLRTVPNPKVPSLGDAIEEALEPHEREELIGRLRPLVEQGRGRVRSAVAYLSATSG
ncbi:class I SAM-dependent methyltransferase [Actinopolymorpha alba]|uniref:class I SAM-dependent methyltransferase n=1 Tax=Actinopolymorpha alba TaxID=533267 RepID=UPI0012F67E04|nr:methyltransferase domain-containing protein [Actinopolymorpha alba]